MKTYTDLTPAQKKWVSLVERFFPKIAERGTITFQELHNVHDFLYSMRGKGNMFKVGFPIWIIQNNAIKRGVYSLPRDTNASLSDVMEELDQEQKVKEYLTNIATQFNINIQFNQTGV